MIWLIGNSGLLGQEIELMFKEEKLSYIGTASQVDITNLDCLQQFTQNKNFDWIINCAAYTAVDNAEEDSYNAFNLNCHAITNITQIAKKKNAKIIHISTDYVFDGTKNSKYTEKDIPNPLNIYGKSKYAGELALTWKKKFILRTSWLFGHNRANFVRTMLNLFNTKKQLKVINDQFGLPTYTKDLVEIIKNIILKDSTKYGTYHCCNNGEKISWFDFASEIYKQARELNLITQDIEISPISTEEYKQPALRPHSSCLSTNKIEQELEIFIRHWKVALKHFLENEIQY